MTEIVVTGAGGAVGSVLMRQLTEARLSAQGIVSLHGPVPHVGRVVRADLSDPRSYRDTLFSLAPKVVVHLAAVSQVAVAYRDPSLAHTINVEATAELLRISAALGARFVYASTDLVFDGEAAPYAESAATEPCSIYGRTKLEAECHVLTYRRGLVLRFPLLYGVPAVDRAPTFFENCVRGLVAGRAAQLFEDEVRTPLWLEDAARACLTLANTALTGVVHLGGPERLSRYQMGLCIASALGAPERLIERALRRDVPSDEPRARDVSLINERYQAELGGRVGRAMAEALPLIFSHKPSRLLS